MKILIAVDFSEQCKRVIEAVLQLVWLHFLGLFVSSGHLDVELTNFPTTISRQNQNETMLS
jgi:hypothetical protein